MAARFGPPPVAWVPFPAQAEGAGVGGMGTVPEASTRLRGRPASVPAARRFVETVLREWGCPEYADVLRLLASEIVTNAIVHARSDVVLRVVLLEDRVRIDVRDASRQAPVPRPPGPDGSGTGLRVVEALAGAWGVDVDGTGKTVWVEVPRERTPAGGAGGMAPSGGAGKG